MRRHARAYRYAPHRCSHVTSLPRRSRVATLALFDGLRKTLTVTGSSLQRMMRLLGMSLHSNSAHHRTTPALRPAHARAEPLNRGIADTVLLETRVDCFDGRVGVAHDAPIPVAYARLSQVVSPCCESTKRNSLAALAQLVPNCFCQVCLIGLKAFHCAARLNRHEVSLSRTHAPTSEGSNRTGSPRHPCRGR